MIYKNLLNFLIQNTFEKISQHCVCLRKKTYLDINEMNFIYVIIKVYMKLRDGTQLIRLVASSILYFLILSFYNCETVIFEKQTSL